jgi:tetratricopeptide (TPR) repeat protein
VKSWLVALVLVASAASARADGTSSARHLLAGVRAFRDAHYEDALVELRIVASSPDAPEDLAFYLGPTLVKLGRHREAVSVFVTSKAPRDALTDVYLGEAYYQLKLYRKARAVFVGLRSRGLGPVLDEAVARYIDAVDAVYRTPPNEATLDYYINAAKEERDPVVVAEFLDEARAVDALATAHPRHSQIVDALAAAWNANGKGAAVIELLAGEPTRSDEGTWQLARAYAAGGDAAHARPMLDAIAKAGGPHAAEATELLSKLSPP